MEEAGDRDAPVLRELLTPHCEAFSLSVEEVLAHPFTRITSHTTRPYGQLHAY